MSTAVVIDIKIKPESIAEAKAFIKEVLPDTRAYEGCQSLEVYENQEGEGSMLFYSIWDSRQHHETYLAWRQETGAFDQLMTMVAEPPTFRYFDATGI